MHETVQKAPSPEFFSLSVWVQQKTHGKDGGTDAGQTWSADLDTPKADLEFMVGHGTTLH